MAFLLDSGVGGPSSAHSPVALSRVSKIGMNNIKRLFILVLLSGCKKFAAIDTRIL
jgi:hypothetical protein